jgi:hypothetical protein
MKTASTALPLCFPKLKISTPFSSRIILPAKSTLLLKELKSASFSISFSRSLYRSSCDLSISKVAAVSAFEP